MMRIALLGLFVLSVLTSGCTIVVQEGSRGRPPPPPPPPRTAQPQPQPQPQPRPHATPPQAPARGTLAVGVLHGSCEVVVDGRSYGVRNDLTVQIAPGSHTVTCRPAGAPVQTRTAVVHRDRVTNVTFALSQPGRPIPKPPVGRPTPTG